MPLRDDFLGWRLKPTVGVYRGIDSIKRRHNTVPPTSQERVVRYGAWRHHVHHLASYLPNFVNPSFPKMRLFTSKCSHDGRAMAILNRLRDDESKTATWIRSR